MMLFISPFAFRISLLCFFIVFLVTISSGQTNTENVLRLKKGTVHFISDAPLELIEATSSEILAVIDTVSGKFAFSIPMTSFLGFNSDLQRIHFNENYMESKLFPNATYTGKMIESWKSATGTPREVRTKGQLTIHGESVERLITAEISRVENQWYVHSEFIVPVTDHNIKIPRLVSQKIASEIRVTLDVWFDAE